MVFNSVLWLAVLTGFFGNWVFVAVIEVGPLLNGLVLVIAIGRSPVVWRRSTRRAFVLYLAAAVLIPLAGCGLDWVLLMHRS